MKRGRLALWIILQQRALVAIRIAHPIAFGLVVEHRCGDIRRRHGVDPHALLGQFQREGLAQHGQRRLARAIRRRTPVGLASGVAGDVDDAALVFLQVGNRGLAHVEGGLEVDSQDQVEILLGEVFHRPLAPDARGIHQGVETSGTGENLRHQGMAVIRAAQVGDPAGVQRHLRVQRVQALLIHIRGGDAPMTLGETLGDCPAQAAGCTSDKNDGRAHLLFLTPVPRGKHRRPIGRPLQ